MTSCSSPPLRLRPSEEIITRIDDPPTELVATLDSPASERHEAAAQQCSSLVHAEESGRWRTVSGSAHTTNIQKRPHCYYTKSASELL
jgi:hypothetical protein